MTRKSTLIGFVAVLALAGGFAGALAAGSADDAALSDLEDEISDQAGATDDALALANDPWIPRVAGLGAGLAVGLIAGGGAAYVARGGDG